jgi:hypothetical protein
VTVVEDTPADLTADLLANDSDVDIATDGDVVSVTGASEATGGEVAFDAGAVTFSPAANLCGAAVGGFDYTIADGHGSTDSAHATVDVTCVNDAPITVDDTAMIDQASGPASYDVLANDSDVEGSPLTLVSATVDPAKGTAGVAANKVTFTPLPSFHGEAIVSYVASDGSLTTSGRLTITVGPDITAPDVVAPVATFGTGRVDETVPVSISWSATDAGVGVGAYTVEVSVAGGPFSTVYSGSGTHVTRYYPFRKALMFRVRAVDRENNASGWVEGTAMKLADYQAPGTRQIRYGGSWVTVRTAKASGTGYRYTTTRGRSATLTFTGRGVAYVAPRSRTSGYVKVYLDGRLVGRYNLHRSSTVNGLIIVRRTWATSGTHTIRIVNDQGGRRTNLDAFVVLR